MDSNSSESNIIIITKRERFRLFCVLYWKIITVTITPFILIPIIYVTRSYAYKSLYIILISATYWISDVLHPGLISLISATLWTIVGNSDYINVYQIVIRKEVLDTLSILINSIAIGKNALNRRIAIKILLVFGCSHYRLSFVLFFTSMFLSMWLSDILTCGLMMPLVKAILAELEKMGILEMYQTVGNTKPMSQLHEHKKQRPTNFTVFYFLGIAYSSSIGGLATIIGSRSNQIFKGYCESLFPSSPPIEFPHIFLLNLPGVLLMETLLYMWLNAYFLGMFRARSAIAIETGMTQEEAAYVKTLLQTEHQRIGGMKPQEKIIISTITLASILQIAFSSMNMEKFAEYDNYMSVSSPFLLCSLLLFILPTNLDFVRFFKRRGVNARPLPYSPSKPCLTWSLIERELNWSILIVIVSTTSTMEALKNSQMITELVKPLESLSGWPAPVLALILILLCKILTELANNACVVYCLLPDVARLSVAISVNPHYMMMAATISSSLPFHLVAGSPVNALVAAYVHIPPWKMMSAGIGPSVIAIIVTWFSVAVWSRVIWTDIQTAPP